MKTIFLTSFVGGYRKTPNGKEVIKIDNSNHFIDRLKATKDKWKTFVMVCSNPDVYGKTDEYTKIFTEAFNLDGFGIENLLKQKSFNEITLKNFLDLKVILKKQFYLQM